jgi:hypothetical protein
MFNDKRIGFDMRANEMITDVDMLGLSMVGIIGRERSCTIVVGGENERRRAADLKLSKGLPEPNAFLNSTRESNVLGFSG